MNKQLPVTHPVDRTALAVMVCVLRYFLFNSLFKLLLLLPVLLLSHLILLLTSFTCPSFVFSTVCILVHVSSCVICQFVQFLACVSAFLFLCFCSCWCCVHSPSRACTLCITLHLWFISICSFLFLFFTVLFSS